MSFNPGLPAALSPTWTATAGSLSVPLGVATTLTAPDRAANPTVNATLLGETCSIGFNVVEPTGYDHADIMGRKYFNPGLSGAGMQLRVVMAPTNVSFYNVEVLEVGEPATNVAGWFAVYGAPTHDSLTGADQWYSLGYDNAWSVFDDAIGGPYNPPWSAAGWSGGSFQWWIPVQWKVGAGTPKALTGWSQTFSLLDDGTVAVTKFNHTVTRHTSQTYGTTQ